jgi:hypothetical protein
MTRPHLLDPWTFNKIPSHAKDSYSRLFGDGLAVKIKEKGQR